MINLGGWELLTPIHQTSQKGSLADTKIQWGDTSSFAIFVVNNSHPGGIISSLLHILMHRNNWNFQRKHTHYLHNVISFFIGTYIGAVGNQSFSQSVKVAIFLQTLHSAHLFLRCSLYSSIFFIFRLSLVVKYGKTHSHTFFQFFSNAVLGSKITSF